MSTPVGTHGLSCVNDDDYAAYALSMKCNADATDAALTMSQAVLNGYISRPYIQVVNATAIVVDDSAGGGSVGPGGLVGELMRPSTSSSVVVTASGLPASYSPFNTATLWPAGVYLMGSTVSWTLAAATASSIRQLLVYGTPEVLGVATYPNIVDLYQDLDYQGDGGNNGALAAAGFLKSDGNMAILEAFFSHANVAGDLTIPVGAWRLWAIYLGSGLVV